MSGFDLEGLRFKVPAPIHGVAENDRLAAALWTGGYSKVGPYDVRYSVDPAACDLRMVRSGRAPLLREHARSIDCLLGAVVNAWSEGGMMHGVVRFAPGPEADRLWSMLSGGFPLSLSMGCKVEHATEEPAGPDGPRYVVGRWVLEELSIVVFGADEDAHVRKFGVDEDVAATVARVNPVGEDPRVIAARQVLRLERWRAWALPAGARLAMRLGVNAEDACDALAELVGEHCDELARSIAA